MTSSARETLSPSAVAVTFSPDGTRLSVELGDGRSISVPTAWYPRLQQGSDRERGHWELIGSGSGIHWPDLDEDISVEGLLSGRRPLEGESSFKKWLATRTGTGKQP